MRLPAKKLGASDMTQIVHISKTELEGIALAAAKTAVQECQASFMAVLGLNIANSADIKEFQATIRFAENLRTGTTKIGTRAAMTMISVLAGATAIASWEYLKGLFHH